MTDDRLARMFKAHAKIKALLAAKAKAHKEDTAPLKDKQELIENGLLKMMNDIGTDQLKVKGLAYCIPKVSTFPSCKDWDALWTHVVATGNFDLVTRRLSSKAIKEYMTANNDALPPGVHIHVERGVTVTRQT